MKRSSLRTFVGGLVTLLVIGLLAVLIYYNTRGYLGGPTVTVTIPQDGETVSSELLLVKGSAQNVTDLTLNGRSIFITDEGAFLEQVLLFPGYNELQIVGTDRFQKTNRQTFRVIYKPPDDPPLLSSTTRDSVETPATSTNP
jgi:hypothetical protein